MEPEEFFELVQSIRRRVQDTYEDDTLIEAIAVELERDHGFVFVYDERLAAAVNVSVEESENFLAEVGPVDDADDERDADYRAILAEFDPDGGRPPELSPAAISPGGRGLERVRRMRRARTVFDRR